MRYLLAVFALALPAQAAITYKANTACTQNTSTTLTCQASIAVAAGDAIVLFGYQNTGVYTVADSCNQNWQKINNTTLGADTWIVLNASACPTDSITVSRPSGTDQRFLWVAATYGGVASVGNMVTNIGGTNNCANSGPTYGCVGTVSIQTADNWVVAGIAGNEGTQQGTTVSAKTGFLRQPVFGTLGSMALVDNTSASIGSVSAGINTSAAFSFGTIIELRAGGGAVGGRNATLADDFQTIILGKTPGNSNYTLPPIKLSDTWCAWVMAVSPGTHQLVIQAPALLNNQSSNIALPEWQKIRVCQDADGNYWANPPFVAGAGVAINATATAIEFSLSSSARSPRRTAQRQVSPRITAGASVTCLAPNAAVFSCQGPTPLAVSPGDTILLVLNTSQEHSITDTCNHQWSIRGGSSTPQIWVGTGGTGTSCMITSNRLGTGNDAFQQWIAVAYSGVQAVGESQTPAPGCPTAPAGGSNTCVRTLTTQADGSTVLAVFRTNTGFTAGTTLSPVTGTQVNWLQITNSTLMVIERTAPTAGSIAVEAAYSNSGATPTSIAFKAVELEVVPPPGLVLTPTPTAVIVSTQ